MTAHPATDPEAVKTCRAAGYATDAVALLLEQSYHPGGLTLTRRLAHALALAPGQRVCDVGTGPGATARLRATEFEVDEPTVSRVRAGMAHAGPGEQVAVHVGDAEQFPLLDATFDTLVCA